MNVTETRAREILCELTGRPDAVFRDGQYEAIDALVGKHQRVLVVQRTGWGKSAVYFVAAKLIREFGGGPTLIVSPLLALMRDQVAAAARAGVSAVTINSSNVTEWDDVLEKLRLGQVDVLLISPERLTNPTFVSQVLKKLLGGVGMVVVDEAHCISDWGHDFRPDYRRIAALLKTLGSNTPVLATTATANGRVVDDVAAQLGEDTLVVRGPLSRDSLRLGVAPMWPAAKRLAWLTSHLRDFPGSGIIYTLTVSAAEDTARMLNSAGYTCHAYTGGTDPDDRIRYEEELKNNEVKALVATSALGMGFDKPDLGFVIHLGAPSSVVAYYQQVGRAGRATDRADVLLLPGYEDPDIWQYFATASMPDEQNATAVLAALTASDQPLSVPKLEGVVGVRRSRLELLLKTLQVDGAVGRVKGGFVATGTPWVYDAERYAGVAATRAAEADGMITYEKTSGCRMVYLAKALDDETATPCGRCDNCSGKWFSDSVDEQSVAEATNTLNKVGTPIEPRRMWPSGMKNIGVNLSGRIDPSLQVEPGKAVARVTDLGAGQVLRTLMLEATPDEPVTKQVAQWCIDVLADFGWKSRPTVVVAMPATSKPILLDSLARGIATVGRMMFAGQLHYTRETGSTDVNSSFRVKNLAGALSVDDDIAAAVEGRPVLLVDTKVNSRWAMTFAGRALKQAGAVAVYPFALLGGQ